MALVIDYGNMESDRGSSMRTLLQEFKEILAKYEDFPESVVFFITKMPENELENIYNYEFQKKYKNQKMPDGIDQEILKTIIEEKPELSQYKDISFHDGRLKKVKYELAEFLKGNQSFESK